MHFRWKSNVTTPADPKLESEETTEIECECDGGRRRKEQQRRRMRRGDQLARVGAGNGNDRAEEEDFWKKHFSRCQR
jgi:hypothetical protein